MQKLKFIVRGFSSPELAFKVFAKGIKMVIGRLKGEETTTVQTVIFDKGQFTEVEARKWLEDHSMKSGSVDETEDSWRFRQRDPGDFKDGSFRTISPGEE